MWIGQLQPEEGAKLSFKRPAALALGSLMDSLPRSDEEPTDANGSPGDGEVRYEERGAIGYLYFNFYNGALSATQCQRLRHAYAQARQRPTRVIVLMGGVDYWCNGMHLHCIEAASSPSDASWDNINKIDDLALDILSTDTHLTIAALQGSAAAGGVFLALAADRVVARNGIVLNAHYRNIGNLYGSAYWTYLLPRRVGTESAQTIRARRLPLGAAEAVALGLVDGHAGPTAAAFQEFVETQATSLAADNLFARMLSEKRARRASDESVCPLAVYRAEELERMRTKLFGLNPSYHMARHRFVYHVSTSQGIGADECASGVERSTSLKRAAGV